MRNNEQQIIRQIQNIIGNEIEIVADDGNIIINSNNHNHEQLVNQLQDVHFPLPNDGVQQGGIVIVNKDNSSEQFDIN